MKSTAIASSESIRVVIRNGASAMAATGSAKLSRRNRSCDHTGVNTPSARLSMSSRNSSLQRSSNSTSHVKSSTDCEMTEGYVAS